MFVPELRKSVEDLTDPKSWKIIIDPLYLKTAVILSVERENKSHCELYLLDPFNNQTQINLKDRLTEAHENYLESSMRASSVVDCYW
jgi:hypothetical protein